MVVLNYFRKKSKIKICFIKIIIKNFKKTKILNFKLYNINNINEINFISFYK